MATTNKPVMFSYNEAQVAFQANNFVPTPPEHVCYQVLCLVRSGPTEQWQRYSGYFTEDGDFAEGKAISLLSGFADYNKTYCNSDNLEEANKYSQVIITVTKISTYLNNNTPQPFNEVVSRVYRNWYTDKEKPKKVYVNGPKKDNDFLKKKGKHYA